MESKLPEEVSEMMKESGKRNSHKSVLALLGTIKRPGIENLIAWLEATDYFTAPASTKFHGCHPGGLVEHSLEVYNKIIYMENMFQFKAKPNTDRGAKPLPITSETFVIAALLHDICKVGAYIDKGDGTYSWNKATPNGHATLSIQRASEFIKLEPIEELMIRYHMGLYGCYERYEPGSWEYRSSAEYHLRSDQTATDKKKMSAKEKEADKESRYGKTLRNACYHNPVVEFFHMADMLATQAEKARKQ